MAQQKKVTQAPKLGIEPATVQSRGGRMIVRDSKAGQNREVLRGLLGAAEAADEGRGIDLTTMTHEERMHALFG